MEEPQYISDIDENGLPVGNIQRRPKRLTPSTPFQERMLKACGRCYFESGWKSLVIAIEKAMMPIAATSRPSTWPSEWVEHCIAWAEKKNRLRLIIKFPALLGYLYNEDKKQEWLADHRKAMAEGPRVFSEDDFPDE